MNEIVRLSMTFIKCGIDKVESRNFDFKQEIKVKQNLDSSLNENQREVYGLGSFSDLL